MAKGYALIIGLEYLDAQHYDGDDGSLFSPEEDAQKMAEIAWQQGFQSITLLKTEAATKANFLFQMRYLQQALEPNDLLLISFAGHGGLAINTDDEETDPEEGEHDETWCFYDGQIIDDVINQLLAGFREDVRILIISDSCHSGTIIREPNEVTTDCQQSTSHSREEICASVILIASAQEDKYAYDGDPYSQFMQILLKVWDDGNYSGNYLQFYDEILCEMDLNQSPSFVTEGKESEMFINSKPFEI